jgi:microsomal dipeptidase-like Zn-dependent dipeptidase
VRAKRGELLVERGWAEPDICKLLGENWLRVFRESLS